jgi:prophage regulatory protein
MRMTTDNRDFGPPGLLRGKEVFRLVALSRTTVWRRIRLGTFPAPVSLGPTRIAWREADVAAWIVAQRPVAYRRQPSGPGADQKDQR